MLTRGGETRWLKARRRRAPIWLRRARGRRPAGRRGPRADGAAARDDALFAYIERFAAVLVAAGFPPMPARVFVALLVTDSGRLSAAELAAVLRISPAAVSGAVRYLIQLGLAHQERV